MVAAAAELLPSAILSTTSGGGHASVVETPVGVADKFMAAQAHVDVPAPVPNDLGINDPVFDEHALRLGHAHKERVKVLLVVLAERAQLALGSILQLDFLRILLDFDFE